MIGSFNQLSVTFCGSHFYGLFCFDLILAALFEGQEFEAQSKRLLELSQLELLGLVLDLYRYEKDLMTRFGAS